VDLGFEDETFGVYQQVTLTLLDLLASVVTALSSSHAGALDRLAVHHPGARLRISFQANPQPLAQGCMDPLPGAVLTPSPEIMVDALPRGKSWGSRRHWQPLLST
jgi:hypothetical protein